MIKLSDSRGLRQLGRILPDHLARLEPHDRLRGRLGLLEPPPVQLALRSAQPQLRQQLGITTRAAEPDRGRGGRKTGRVLARLELCGGEIEQQERPRGVCCAGEVILFDCWKWEERRRREKGVSWCFLIYSERRIPLMGREGEGGWIPFKSSPYL